MQEGRRKIEVTRFAHRPRIAAALGTVITSVVVARFMSPGEAVVFGAGVALAIWWVDRGQVGVWVWVRAWGRACRASGLAVKSAGSGRKVTPPLLAVAVGPEVVQFEFVPLDGASFDGPGFAAALGLVSARSLPGRVRLGRRTEVIEVRRLAALRSREVTPMRLQDFPVPFASDVVGVDAGDKPGIRCEQWATDKARGTEASALVEVRCASEDVHLPEECRRHWYGRRDDAEGVTWFMTHLYGGSEQARRGGLCDRLTEGEISEHGFIPPSPERLAAMVAAAPTAGVRDRDGYAVVTGHAHCIKHQLLAERATRPGPDAPAGLLVQHPEPYGSWREALSAVTIGASLGGEPWRLRLVENHVLIAGLTGAGKGSVIWSLLVGLAPFVAAGAVEVWGFDPKRSELAMGRDIFKRYGKEPGDMLAMLEEAVQMMVTRADKLAHERRRRFEPGPGERMLVLVLDELGDLSGMYDDRAEAQRFDRALTRLLNLGRSNGIVLVAGLQDPRKKVLDSRDLWPTKVAMRMPKSMADLVLGSGAYDAGAFTDRIPVDAQGTAFVVDDGGAPVEVRAGWVSDDAILQTEQAVVALRQRQAARQVAAALVPVLGQTPDTGQRDLGQAVA